MASGAGFALDAINTLKSNRALLKKKGPFSIHKRNGFIKTTGKKFRIKKLTPAQRRLMRIKVKSYQKSERKRLATISALTILTTLIVVLMSTQITKLFF